MFYAKVIADSIGPARKRLTTMEVRYPRIILAEMNTHRVFSRNTASSRAIPTQKMLTGIKDDPYFPIDWGKNQSGMQAGEQLGGLELDEAKYAWNNALENALVSAQELMNFGLHKEKVNRIVEPFAWTTQIITSTLWANFFAQRITKFAQPEIYKIAHMMRQAMRGSTPVELIEGQWHLPYIQDDEWGEYPIEDLVKFSAARCARVSYVTHDGIKVVSKDLELFDKLVGQSHWSPLEHPAQVNSTQPQLAGNFVYGWAQLRKLIEVPVLDD